MITEDSGIHGDVRSNLALMFMLHFLNIYNISPLQMFQ